MDPCLENKTEVILEQHGCFEQIFPPFSFTLCMFMLPFVSELVLAVDFYSNYRPFTHNAV